MPRVRDMRVEEMVKNQLAELNLERSEVTASRAFDRIRGSDWSLLRSYYPDLYGKAMRQANLIPALKQRRGS